MSMRLAVILSGWRRLAALLALALPALASAAVDAAATAPLRMSWELERSVFDAAHPGGRSRVALVLTNLDGQPLPAQGWAIYFSSMAGVQEGPSLEGQVLLERVVGPLIRMRPAPGFQPLAAGQTLRIVFLQSELLTALDKAPQGPYLVLDSAPGVGRPLREFKLLQPQRAEQLALAADDPEPLATPEAIYRRNAATADLPADALPPVFPPPLQLERRDGKLELRLQPRVVASAGLRGEAALARALFQPYLAAGRAGAVTLALSVGKVAGQSSPEAYELTLDAASGIALRGNSAAGVSRGLQSLRALLPAQPQRQSVLLLPALRIVDAPRFEFRGLMLDVARNFQSKDEVLKVLELMARLKLNKLHLHLVDDEGWRLEIAGLPELTAVGGRRGHSADALAHLPSAYGSGPDLADPHGSGHYSRADYIEILRFAQARHIEVIPEIEMPGHSRAAVKAMERRTAQRRLAGQRDAQRYLLSDPADRSVYVSAQLYTDHVMNPGLDSTYAFIEHVVAEVVALHRAAGVPLHSLHVGGDELPRGVWERSPACQALMQRLKLDSTAALWDHFYERVDAILRRHGLVASGWEELGTRREGQGAQGGVGRLQPNPRFARRGFNVFVWNNLDDNVDLAYRLANAGYPTVLAPVTNLYLDMVQQRDPQEPGHNWAGYLDLDRVFDYVPLDALRGLRPAPQQGALAALDEQGRRHIRGLEATLFAETVSEPWRIGYMLMPRLFALAERAWVADPAWTHEADAARAKALHAADWSRFVNQVGKQVLPRLDAQGPGLDYRIAPPGLTLGQGLVLVNHQLPGLTLRYTKDGSEPDAKSAPVLGPIADKGLIRVAAFNSLGRRGRVSSITNP